MSNMRQAQEQILQWLKLNRHEYFSSLKDGFLIKEIGNKTKVLPFELSQEVYQLYQWKNGSSLLDTTSFDICFIPSFLFLSLEKSIEEYYLNIDIFKDDWQENWFPIFSLEGYSYFTLCQKASVDNSSIWFYDYEQPEPILCYESLTMMICVIADCYETGAYYMNSQGLLKENKAQVNRIINRYRT